MGRTYLFECAKCGYHAKVAGGAERGQQLRVQTIHCLDCRELRDVVTALRRPDSEARNPPQWKLKPTAFEPLTANEPPPALATALNFLAVRPGQAFRWVQYRLECPTAAWHRIRPWKQPGKCPKCGVFLDGSATPFTAWD